MDSSFKEEGASCRLGMACPSPVEEHCFCEAFKEDSVNELVRGFGVSLHLGEVKSAGASNLSFASHCCHVVGEEKIGESSTESCCLKRLCKCATFPARSCPSSATSDGKGKAPVYQTSSYMRSVSLPTKVVSALKGSREKYGASPRKLTVSWAPDVYDPEPSSVSHLPRTSQQQYSKRSKKQRKGKQKGKNSKGSNGGSKEKKHRNKRAEPEQPPRSVQSTPESMRHYKSGMGLLDFDVEVDSPDSNCGSSFMRKARSALHVPYAETT